MRTNRNLRLLVSAACHCLSDQVPFVVMALKFVLNASDGTVGAKMLWNPDSQRMCSDLSDATEEDYELHCSFSLALAVDCRTLEMTAERW